MLFSVAVNTNAQCSSDYTLGLTNSYRVQGSGKMSKAPGDCVYNFVADPTTTSDCTVSGVCYLFSEYTYFKDDKVSLMVGSKVSETQWKTYHFFGTFLAKWKCSVLKH